jgi:hypothetical protein
MKTLPSPQKKRHARNGRIARVRTFADLLHDLGDIPAERVWLTPPPGTATEKDVIEADVKYNRHCELIDGTLVEKTMGFREGREAIVLCTILETHTEKHDVGIVAGADATIRLMPRLVRIPDASFVSWERLPGRKIPSEPIPDLVPNLYLTRGGLMLGWHRHSCLCAAESTDRNVCATDSNGSFLTV